MQTAIIFALALSISCVHAEQPFDYKSIVEFVNQRAEASIPPDQCIYVLGPQFSNETYFNNGKETSEKVPYCRASSIKNNKTLNKLIDGIGFSQKEEYQILIYRAKNNFPSAKIIGTQDSLRNSQFPLQGGDVVYITPSPKQK